ncbi:MAG: tetratricopeptide repeat protein [Myxococcales bacterium]|nr:MAG: tetratricopeptide repeat protein [Myxococcales bacterium]
MADSKRFAESSDPGMPERRENALINAAHILEYQQDYAKAAQYYARAAETTSNEEDRRAAYYRVAEMAFKRELWPKAIAEMKSFIKRYQSDPAAGEVIVQAYWRIAQARAKLKVPQRDYHAALQDVVAAYARSGQSKGSLAAEYAAESKFILVDAESGQFEDFAIKPGIPKTLDAYVKTVMDQINKGSVEAKAAAEGYNPIPAYGRPKWSIAAFVRQGRVYEVLARAVLNTPFAMPADLKKQLKKSMNTSERKFAFKLKTAFGRCLTSKSDLSNV